MLAATKRQVSFLATWYRVSQTTHYFKQTCKLSISPLFITNMTCAFQRFYGKQRMLSKNVRIFHSPTIQQGHKATQRSTHCITDILLHYIFTTRVQITSALAQYLPRSVSPLMIAFSSARSSFFMRMSSGT